MRKIVLFCCFALSFTLTFSQSSEQIDCDLLTNFREQIHSSVNTNQDFKSHIDSLNMLSNIEFNELSDSVRIWFPFPWIMPLLIDSVARIENISEEKAKAQLQEEYFDGMGSNTKIFNDCSNTNIDKRREFILTYWYYSKYKLLTGVFKTKSGRGIIFTAYYNKLGQITDPMGFKFWEAK